VRWIAGISHEDTMITKIPGAPKARQWIHRIFVVLRGTV
jgi:hypothetical protein